jgi:hypothetical protein
MTTYYCNNCMSDKSNKRKKGCRLKMSEPDHSEPFVCVIGGKATWVPKQPAIRKDTEEKLCRVRDTFFGWISSRLDAPSIYACEQKWDELCTKENI